MTTPNLALELASLNAWPALEQREYDGWVLRFSRGYTKRANSVTPLRPTTLAPELKIAWCEQRYAERSLPCMFRITPFASPPDLDAHLQRRGYVVLDRTLVLYRSLAPSPPPKAPPLGWQEHGPDDWLDRFCEIKGEPRARHITHRAMINRIDRKSRLLVTLQRSGRPVSCAMAVLSGAILGLFDVATAQAYRCRGYATALLGAILDWARARGAQHAYVQVVESNAPAQRLYVRLGYAFAYRYWYRVPPDCASQTLACAHEKDGVQ